MGSSRVLRQAQNLEKIRNGGDGDTACFLQREQVPFIASHQTMRLCRDRAFDEHLVIGVGGWRLRRTIVPLYSCTSRVSPGLSRASLRNSSGNAILPS